MENQPEKPIKTGAGQQHIYLYIYMYNMYYWVSGLGSIYICIYRFTRAVGREKSKL